MITTLLFYDSKDVAQFVESQLHRLQHGLPWTMTIRLGKYGEFYAVTVTEELSEDTEETTVAEFFSATQVNT